MACDYLAIPATSCIAECSFSMFACTDQPRQGGMNRVKFGALQKLRAGYLDGRISANFEIVKKVCDFFFDEDDYSE